MIKNARQSTVTKKQIEFFEGALGEVLGQDEPEDSDDALFRQIQVDGIRGQLEDLKAEVRAYDDLLAGRAAALDLSVIESLPDALIAARISAGMTQKELAERLGIKEQMIQRYEATDYVSASYARVRSVARALQDEPRDEARSASADRSKDDSLTGQDASQGTLI